MKHVLFLFLLSALSLSVPARAQQDVRFEEFGITEDEFIKQADSDPRQENDMLDRISDLDINSDGAISSTEKDEMIKGLDFLSFMTEQEKTAWAAYVGQAFEESDSDKNDRLSGDEIKLFAKKIQMFMIKHLFRQMDRNHDGVINSLDTPPIEESLQKLKEATEQMKAATEKLNQISPKEMAKNFITNISASIAKEDFYQMDKDKNGCVTVDEYADYSVSKPSFDDDDDPDDKFALTREDYVMLFGEIKKASPSCMTLEEYVADQSKTADRIGEM